MERTKMPNFRNGSKGGFEPGLTWLRVRHSTTELPRMWSSRHLRQLVKPRILVFLSCLYSLVKLDISAIHRCLCKCFWWFVAVDRFLTWIACSVWSARHIEVNLFSANIVSGLSSFLPESTFMLSCAKQRCCFCFPYSWCLQCCPPLSTRREACRFVSENLCLV